MIRCSSNLVKVPGPRPHLNFVGLNSGDWMIGASTCPVRLLIIPSKQLGWFVMKLFKNIEHLKVSWDVNIPWTMMWRIDNSAGYFDDGNEQENDDDHLVLHCHLFRPDAEHRLLKHKQVHSIAVLCSNPDIDLLESWSRSPVIPFRNGRHFLRSTGLEFTLN